MFAKIRGIIDSISEGRIIVFPENIGIGYEIFASPLLLSNITLRQDMEIPLYHHKTEQSEILFGFLDEAEKSIFRQLLRVNGVGGKTALAILGLGPENILRALETSDDTLLATVPGIGKKTAQKIIVDLKGTLSFASLESTPKKKTLTSNIGLMSSLIQMGYDKGRVEEVLEHISGENDIQSRTIEAIRMLSQ